MGKLGLTAAAVASLLVLSSTLLAVGWNGSAGKGQRVRNGWRARQAAGAVAGGQGQCQRLRARDGSCLGVEPAAQQRQGDRARSRLQKRDGSCQAAGAAPTGAGASGEPEQLRKRDGSCLAPAAPVSVAHAGGDRQRLRNRDGSCR